MAVSEEESSSSSSAAGGSSKSRSGGSNGACYLAKTVLRGSVVLQVVYGRIRSSSSYDVVFGKETSIELLIIDEDGVVQSICEQPVFGIIKDIAVLPWNEKFRVGSPQLLGKDLLVVISDSGKLSVLRFCNEMHRFFAVTHVQLSSPGNPMDQIGRMLAIDTNGCFIAASAYEDSLALFSRSASAGGDIIDKVEMVPSKRLNVQKFHFGGTPRKVLYHNDSRLLLVLRTDLSDDLCSSDVCCIDPLSGSVLSSFKFEPGEIGKCMELVKAGNEQVLVVGTGLSSGPAIMPSGEAESTKGRLIVLCLEQMQNSDSGSIAFSSRAGSSSQRTSPFREIGGYAAEQLSNSSLCSSPDDNSCDGIKLEESEAWHLRLGCSTTWPGMVLAVCPYLDRYFLASAANCFYVCGFPNDNSQRVRRLAVGRTRFMIMSLTAHFTRIAVGDCRDGVLFYSYQEDARKLDQVYCDPVQRLVADCTLMDGDTAAVSDRKGSLAILSCLNQSEDSSSPERNLALTCSFYMGEIAIRIRKGSFSYKLPADDALRGCQVSSNVGDISQNSIMASTLLGSIIIFIPLAREEYDLLEAVQASLVIHPLTAPILGNDHTEYRCRGSMAKAPKALDGDMLAQFLELTSMQQEAVLALPLGAQNTITFNSKQSPTPITVNQVVRLLERVHYALN